MKKYSQFFKFFKFSKGFTLVELLAAMSITLVVMTVAGSGLVVIMNADQKAAIATDRRTNLNRALDFIADEIRGSSKVSAGSGTVVLSLTVPSSTSNTVYSVESTTTNWASPYTINRTDVTGVGMLVDGVAKVTQNSSCNYPTNPVSPGYRMTVTKGTTTASACVPLSDAPPICATGIKGNNGFFACIAADNRTVDLYLYGQVSDTNPKQYAVVKTTAFARTQ